MGEWADVVDLFVRGAVVVLDEDRPALVWVAKLNRFEREDVLRASRVAQSRRRLALQEVGSDDLDLLDGLIAALSEADLVNALVDAHAVVAARTVPSGLRADPEWEARLEVMDRGEHTTVEEELLLNNIRKEFLAEVQRRVEDELGQQRDMLTQLPRDRLEARYRNEWVAVKARDAFTETFDVEQLLRCARMCDATRDGGGWSHAACHHERRLFASIAQLREAPDEVTDALRAAVDGLSLTLEQAKNSDRPVGSSAPSAQRNAQAASSASTQTEISPAPAGT